MSSASALELGASTREQRESREAAHRAAKLAQRLWEAENPNYDRFLGGADAHLRDWSRVQARLDPDGNGQVEIDTWLHRVQEVVFNVDKAHLAMKRHFVAQFGGMTQAQLDLTFPEFSTLKIALLKPDIVKVPKSDAMPIYDLIIGVETLASISSILNFANQTVTIDHVTLPMRPHDSLMDPEVLESNSVGPYEPSSTMGCHPG